MSIIRLMDEYRLMGEKIICLELNYCIFTPVYDILWKRRMAFGNTIEFIGMSDIWRKYRDSNTISPIGSVDRRNITLSLLILIKGQRAWLKSDFLTSDERKRMRLSLECSYRVAILLGLKDYIKKILNNKTG